MLLDTCRSFVFWRRASLDDFIMPAVCFAVGWKHGSQQGSTGLFFILLLEESSWGGGGGGGGYSSFSLPPFRRGSLHRLVLYILFLSFMCSSFPFSLHALRSSLLSDRRLEDSGTCFVRFIKCREREQFIRTLRLFFFLSLR